MDSQTYKVVKQQIELIKNSLDLNVHNLKFFADIDFSLIMGHDFDYPSKPDPFGVNEIIKNAGSKKKRPKRKRTESPFPKEAAAKN